MGFLAGLFGMLSGSGRQPKAVVPIAEDIEADPLASVILRPGFRTPVGKLGGQPDLPARHDWPRSGDAPLSFLAQLDLAALRRLGGPDWLPDQGALFFFYGVDQSRWGSDSSDRANWSVIHDPDGFAASPRTSPADGAYGECAVGGCFFASIPDAHLADEQSREADRSAFAGDEYEITAGEVADGPWHQVGGYPTAIQSDEMALECQLASSGLDMGNAKVYASAKARELAPGAVNWRLLLQIDGDEATGMEWGDTGMLYFWIREHEARRGDFAGAWMILQSN